MIKEMAFTGCLSELINGLAMSGLAVPANEFAND